MRCLVALALFCGAALGAPAAPQGDLAGRVQAWLDSWSRLAGTFEQRLASPTLPSEQVETGRFEIIRPDRMRWDYVTPEEKLAVTDGVHTWLYVPSDRLVIRGRVDALRDDSAISLLLSGALRLDEAFEVKSTAIIGLEARLDLVPRRVSENIQEIHLRCDPVSGRVFGFEVNDAADNRVRWRLEDIQIDPAIDENRFTFEVPRGVEIQDIDDSVDLP
ncbi:MAG: outer membrane lipoprotein carrier protein LolA [Acidobacteriota bacterium]